MAPHFVRGIRFGHPPFRGRAGRAVVHVQERIPAERLGRTLSYATLGQLLPVPVGYLLAGPVSAALGVRPTLAWGAALIGAAAVVPLAVGQVRGLSRQVSGTVSGMAPSARADR
ncbi:hypothetical protein [Streptomyces sp. NPDC054863]